MADVVDWSVGDVCGWAATCGLAHLEEVLRRNRVDGAALAVVTREEIRDELQVEAYLDRRRLWDAVLKLRATSNAVAAAAAAASSTSSSTSASSNAGSLPLPPLLASASAAGLGDDGADVESQLSSSACVTPATHSHADPSGSGWPTPLLSPLEATGSSSFYSFTGGAPLNTSGSSLARASSSHAAGDLPPSPGSNGLGRSLARSFSEQDAGGAGGGTALSRSLSLGGRSSPTAGSADGSSQHSLSLRARRMHTLTLNEENRIPSPQLELTVSHLTSLLRYQVTADSIGALLCAGPSVHLEMLVKVLARLIYGLVGKRSPSRSVLEHDPLPPSALTLLRSYGYGGGSGSGEAAGSAGSPSACDDDGTPPPRPATLLSAARAMQSLPLGRFVRDALRVCEGVGAVKGTRAPLTQQDVAAFVQVFSLRDLLLQLEAPPPPPLPEAQPPAALKKQQKQQQQQGSSSGKAAASPSSSSSTTTSSSSSSASAVDADTLLASMRAAARLDAAPDAASGVVTLETLLCAVFRDLAAPASSGMPSPHDALPPSAAVMLGAYGLVPGRTTSETAAGVLAAPPQDARRLVGDLLKVLQVRTHADLAALVAASAASARPRPPAGAGARPAAGRGRGGGGGGGGVGVAPTAGAPPQVGQRVRVKRCADEVELHCRRNARIGWDVDMAVYVGAEGCVGKLAGGGTRVRVTHDDGAVWTWPVDVIEDAAGAAAGDDCADDAAVVVVAVAAATAAGEDGAAERAAPGSSRWGLRGRVGGRQPEAAPAAKPELPVEEELQAV